MNSAVKRTLCIAALITILILSALGWVDRGFNACGLGQLESANAHYLENAFDKSLAGFLLLSTIKSGLAIVEGSEVGIGFNLELGDIVQPMYDYVDIAWRASLAGGSILVGMQLALKGLRLVDHWALTGLGSILIIYFLTLWIFPQRARLHKGLIEAVRFGTALCVALYLLLPLSVTGAAVLSQKITQPMIEAAQEELQTLSSTLSPTHISQHFLADSNDHGFSAQNLKSALANAGRGVQALITYLKTETDRIAALTIKLVAAYLFDCVLFPFFFGMIFLTVIKSGVQYFFDLNRPQGGTTV